MQLKKILMMGALFACVTGASAAELSLAEARAQLGDCIKTPAKMTAVMKQLSAADQKSFLADANEAISKMPGSSATKAATFLNVNHAALKGAAKGNLLTLVAEVFATVPPEYLTTINERFASDLFNRAADPSVTYTDAQFTEIAEKLIDAVSDRMQTVENGAARTTFAILMMIRASNGTPDTLTEALIKKLPEDAQNVARTEWIPAALGITETKDYEPILGGAQVIEQLPPNDLVMRIAGPQLLDALLGQIVEGIPVVRGSFNLEKAANLSIKDQQAADHFPSPIPESKDETEEGGGGQGGTDEPGGYQGQY